MSSLKSVIVQINGIKESNDLHPILNELNARKYDLQELIPDQIDVLQELIERVDPSEPLLAIKLCQLISKLPTVVWTGGPQLLLTSLATWIVRVIERGDALTEHQSMIAFAVVLRGNGLPLEELWIKLHEKEILQKLLGSSDNCLVVSTIACYGAFCSVSESGIISDSSAEMCLKLFLQYLHEEPKKDLECHQKILITSLQGITDIAVQHSSLLPPNLATILGALRFHMFHGLVKTECQIPQRIYASPMPMPEEFSRNKQKDGSPGPQSRKLGSNRKKIKQQALSATSTALNFTNSIPTVSSSSDSEMSDSGSSTRKHLLEAQITVRNSAYMALHAVIKHSEHRSLFGFWPALFSGFGHSLSQSSHSAQFSILTCLLREPSTRARNSGLAALVALLDGAGSFLAMAQMSKTRLQAFTPLAATIADIVHDIHRCIGMLLASESSSSVLVHIMKVALLLIKGCNYHHLSPGTLKRIVFAIRPFLSDRDGNVVSRAFTVMSAIVTARANPLEICLMLTSNQRNELPVLDDELEGIFSADRKAESWLVEDCLECLFDDKVQVTVKHEVVQTITAISRGGHMTLLQPSLQRILKVIIYILTEVTDERLKCLTADAIQAIGTGLQQNIDGSDLNLDQSLYFWQALLDGPLPTLLQENSPSLQIAACLCFTRIGTETVEQLKTAHCRLIVTLMLGTANSTDLEPAVRGAALRALGTVAMYDSLCEDIGFLTDMADCFLGVLKGQKDVDIISNSVWAIANMADSLITNMETNKSPSAVSEIDFQETLAKNVWVQLIGMLTKFSDYRVDRIAFNAVRALGNLICSMPQCTIHQFEFQELKKLLEEAISALLKCASKRESAKVRWNSCHGLGTVLRNEHLNDFIGPWKATVISTLSEVTLTCNNFKVRTQAAAALAVPLQRSGYGNTKLFHETWCLLCDAVSKAEVIEQPSEIRHQEQLLDQLCLTLSHMVSMVHLDDLIQLHDSLLPMKDLVDRPMKRLWNSSAPATLETLKVADERVQYLQSVVNDGEYGEETRGAAYILCEMFGVPKLGSVVAANFTTLMK